MSVRRLTIPGDATRRDYAVYVMVAVHRETKGVKLYVGKTGDNREGCNPVISRAGNHFSFNKIHSQMRNHLQPDDTYDYDFTYFYTTFGSYVPPSETREWIDLINEMERRLNKLAQVHLGEVMNPYRGGRVQKDKQKIRDALYTAEHQARLQELVDEVAKFLAMKEEMIEAADMVGEG